LCQISAVREYQGNSTPLRKKDASGRYLVATSDENLSSVELRSPAIALPSVPALSQGQASSLRGAKRRGNLHSQHCNPLAKSAQSPKSMSEINNLLDRLRVFATDRDWEQFHSPKNISMALAVEASELLEHFQWMTEADSRALDPEQKAEVADEVADVFLYILRLCDQMDIDLIKTANQKIDKNALKYPVEKSKGRSTKYNKL
jgi:NTP pyrophosphatase (non-canonical NTP hydrolase)